MNKVLFKSAKPIYNTMGCYIRNLRLNNNLLQREIAKILHVPEDRVSKLEHGRMRLEQFSFEKMCVHFCIPEEDQKMLQPYVGENKKQKKMDYLKSNLGDYVKRLREIRHFMAYDISMAISDDRCLIGAIESHNQPFKKEEIEKFISVMKLNIVETEDLMMLNDYFEWQPKPNREATVNERLIITVMNGVRYKDTLERREYLYTVRDKR